VLIGIVSDIHSNLPALKESLNILDNEFNIDGLICAGDIVGYYPWPLNIIDILLEHNAHVVLGNHDAISVTNDNFNHEIRYFNDIAKTALNWTRKKLKSSASHWDYLQSLSLVKTVEFDNCKFFVCHATPVHPEEWDYFYYYGASNQDEQLREWLEINRADILIMGHTHVPFIFKTKDKLPKIVLNPGSVGQPRDNDSRGSFMVVDTKTREITHRRFTYDIQKVCKELKKEKLPEYLCQRLLVGR